MKTNHQTLGSLGEKIGCRYLEQKGYLIKDTNFQNTKGYKYGEIDIIAIKCNTLVFVEVKTRKAKQGEAVFPEENISPSKIRNLEKIATTYRHLYRLENMDYRFDALAICWNEEERKAKVKHFEYIFF
jgi:putative endonuclease